MKEQTNRRTVCKLSDLYNGLVLEYKPLEQFSKCQNMGVNIKVGQQ